jgi:hypothetical protein
MSFIILQIFNLGLYLCFEKLKTQMINWSKQGSLESHSKKYFRHYPYIDYNWLE